MEGLTKENFWNEMMEKHPVAMKRFCIWVDEYKERTRWDVLFNAPLKGDAPKFHDLPLAMQIGIFGQFSNETWGLPFVKMFEGSKRLIEEEFMQVEKALIAQENS